jgi:hypothetical protein
MRAALRGALAAGVAWAALAACSDAGWRWTTPPVMDEAALLEHLRPRGGERLVVANFWATW